MNADFQARLLELHWAAGFWDGEGCTSYHKQYRHGRRYLYPILSISQTDREVLDRFHASMGGKGSIHPMPGNGSTKPYHMYRASGWLSAGLFFNTVFPFLSRLKQEQFLRVWDDCKRFKENPDGWDW